MKLDKRIENERLIYTPFTTNKPKLHEKGYFTDDIHAFNSLEDCDCRYGELVEHDGVDYAYPYCCESDDGCGDGNTTCDWFAFYIPESSLKREEKQFSRHEQRNNKTITYIYIGSNRYTLDELFDNYEWQEHYTEDFKPFGVLEE